MVRQEAARRVILQHATKTCTKTTNTQDHVAKWVRKACCQTLVRLHTLEALLSRDRATDQIHVAHAVVARHVQHSPIYIDKASSTTSGCHWWSVGTQRISESCMPKAVASVIGPPLCTRKWEAHKGFALGPEIYPINGS